MITIAKAYNGYEEKFGIPRQSGRAESVLTRIVFESDFRIPEALRGIEQWSHLWLIWGFSENKTWSPTVRPPRLGGNKRVGVFATRSPFRPNNIGLSSVKLVKVEQTPNEGIVLIVSGADLMNGTPIYDIKPYLPYTDVHTDASSGFVEQITHKLRVEISDSIAKTLPEQVLVNLKEILSDNPRPAYQNDHNRIYGMTFQHFQVHFRVDSKIIKVLSIKQINPPQT